MAGTLDDRIEQWLNEPHKPERAALIAIVDHCAQKEQAGWTCVSTDFLREVITQSLEVEPEPPAARPTRHPRPAA